MNEPFNKNLTKSEFLLYCEAPRHLWARVNNRMTVQTSEFTRLLGEQGYQVESLARDYLEQVVLPQTPGARLNWQATFQSDFFEARADALVNQPGSESYDLYEIKSSTAVDQADLVDVAFQVLILDQHICIDHYYLLHLKKEYSLVGELNLSEVFLAEDITQAVQVLLPEVQMLRVKARQAALSASPGQLEGCYSPADCPCPEVCHPGLPGFSIFDVPRLGEQKKQRLLDAGIRSAGDIPDDFPLNEKQRCVVQLAKSGQPHLDQNALRAELEKYQYPLYFLDYETCISAIPLYPGYHPQQQVVFQYSLHGMPALSGEVSHSEHLSITSTDPALPLLEQLRSDLGAEGSVLVWNKAFEMSRNREMAELHPPHAGFLEQLNQRIEDLGDVISRGIYLHPGFKGSWSLKNVLPAMLPGLSYDGMPIQQGGQASLIWWQLRFGQVNDTDRASLVEAMLRYCELDTWAMVAILREFWKLV